MCTKKMLSQIIGEIIIITGFGFLLSCTLLVSCNLIKEKKRNVDKQRERHACCEVVVARLVVAADLLSLLSFLMIIM